MCGIATFTASLREAMAVRCSGVVALVDEPGLLEFGTEVVGELIRGSADSMDAAADALGSYDVAIVQHEFGIYGGVDGRDVVDLISALEIPVIVVLHTVLHAPSASQRSIIEEFSEMADAVVVQTLAARARLLETHTLDPERLIVVPHGARLNLDASTGHEQATVLTWGLLGPDKGIEFGIEALSRLSDLDPPPRYVVHGGTHPRVLERDGEAYRDSLVALAHARNVASLVEFVDHYVPVESVLAAIRAADVVLLPYRSHDQVVSGVLVEAIASGKPVVATRFPHAEELLVAGSGILVPHEDPDAIARALRRILTDDDLRRHMENVARRQARALAWPNVGRAYRELALSVASGDAAQRVRRSFPNRCSNTSFG
jgi:glycosyltransferase involved in cell wall biosynthesis